MRALDLGDLPGLKTGASKSEIQNMPVYRYRATNEAASTESTAQSQGQGEDSKKTTKKGFMHRLLKQCRPKREEQDFESTYEYLTLDAAEDSVCSICLSEYENNDLLCKLWCRHHFHKSCVQEWLALNTKCPLCKQDFRGKEYYDSDDVENE
ncbi:hypothetical protein EC973_000852 [Apophysomyces ossiformis]|uniref:RING-type E3 ubiquitin transferase n=1 Tax=Apophysomyces ossiformis TaxID=679940 RepID=A0A8H7ENY4_9FUNG|nr:hypothetical protein EC973_000852 [Apophysomyces ossiformis]